VPIHDQSYRRYKGLRSPKGRAWTVIATAGVRNMLRKRAFLGLLILAWLPFFYQSIMLYLASNYPQMSIISPSPKTFRSFLEFQGVFVFFITIFTGAGLIANDMRANALQIYLAKPLDRVEYIAGKFAVLAFFLLLVTWLPATMLVVLQIVFAGNLTFISSNFFVLPAILVYTGIETTVLGLVMLALSSLSKSARFVGIMYAGVIFFTQALYGVMYAVTHNSSFSWMAPSANLAQLSYLIFRLPGRFETSGLVTGLALAVTVALAVFVLERRVRGVEVVT
jgi:ABC-type transport system involved in multi-copper enzyme maturation permease subunit